MRGECNRNRGKGYVCEAGIGTIGNSKGNTTEGSKQYVHALVNKGAALMNLGNYTGAIPYFDKALAIDPQAAVVLNNQGKARTLLGGHMGAVCPLVDPWVLNQIFHSTMLRAYVPGIR
jgi:tetratricopeptide (TPR) repeat protein